MRLERGLPGAIVENSNEITLVDGQPRIGVNLAMSRDQFEQFRTGYRCLRCYGVQDEPFPEVCKESFCNFRIRDDQLRYLENEHRGEHRYGPSEDDTDFERECWQPRSGIWLPHKQ